MLLLAWIILSKVFPDFSLSQIIQLCGVYTLSWAIGFISMLTPGGIGIRETIFIYFGQPILNNSELAFFSIFLRFWLISIDIFIALLATTLLKQPVNKDCRFDQNGYNILDPHDFLGKKSEYITLLQSKAIDQHLPHGTREQIAVDLGCGYGRLTKYIDQKGWHVIGIDPDENLIKIAREENPQLEFRVGGLPQLPVTEHSIHLLVMHNMIRVLHLMNKIALLDNFEKYMHPASQIYVVDNIRKGHKNYFNEESLISLMRKKGFTLTKAIALRSARNWWIWLIWAGLIPRSLFHRIAEAELRKMSEIKNRPSWQYYNILFIFE
ncbi:MAG: class I SAM-dependent methyltransferase, partial [Candidatus Moranbacteria bacterium]|nr:class I SAM-dependent methyltransferase [Candidatus Moranbacteria bacterium]